MILFIILPIIFAVLWFVIRALLLSKAPGKCPDGDVDERIARPLGYLEQWYTAHDTIKQSRTFMLTGEVDGDQVPLHEDEKLYEAAIKLATKHTTFQRGAKSHEFVHIEWPPPASLKEAVRAKSVWADVMAPLSAEEKTADTWHQFAELIAKRLLNHEGFFDCSHGPLFRIIANANVNAIFLLIHHSVADGQSGVIAFNTVVSYLKGGDEAARVSSPTCGIDITQLVDTRPTIGLLLSKVWETFGPRFAQLPKAPLYVPMNRIRDAEHQAALVTERVGSHGFTYVSVSAEQLARIVRKCRANKVSVHAFFSAAAVHVIRSIADEEGETRECRVVLGFPLSFRTNVSDAWRERICHSAGTFVTGTDMSFALGARRTLWSDALVAKRHIDESRSRAKEMIGLVKYAGNMSTAIMKQRRNGVGGLCNTVNISNVGDVSYLVDPLTRASLKRLHLMQGGHNGAAPAIILSLLTTTDWNDEKRLFMSVASTRPHTDAQLSPTFARKLLHIVDTFDN